MKIKKYIANILVIVLGITLSGATSVLAGSLTPSAAPSSDATMYSLTAIYEKLTTGSTSLDAGELATTSAVAASQYTLEQIFDALPEWRTLSNSTTTVAAGYYEATTLDAVDSDLVAENIADGVTLFGVEGSISSLSIPATGQTTSYYANDDGDLEIGATVSLTDNGDGTITDNVTGIIWEQDASTNNLTWEQAIDYCVNNVEGLPGTGWRLPNVKEFIAIADYGADSWTETIPSPPFTNINRSLYYTGNQYKGNVNYVTGFTVQDGKTGFISKSLNPAIGTICVRDAS